MRESYLKPSEVAEKVRISRSSLFRWVREGRFPAPIKLGKRVLWAESEVETFLSASKKLAPKK